MHGNRFGGDMGGAIGTGTGEFLWGVGIENTFVPPAFFHSPIARQKGGFCLVFIISMTCVYPRMGLFVQGQMPRMEKSKASS